MTRPRYIVLVLVLLGCKEPGELPLGPAAFHVQEAVKRLQQDLPADALAHADSAIALAPWHPHGHFVLGQANYVLGNYAASHAAWEHTARLDPENWAWWQSLGDVAFQLDDYGASLEYYERSLEMHADPISWHGAAGALWEMNRPHEAQIACEMAVALDSTYAPAYLSLAMFAEHDGLLDDALRLATTALALAPGSVPALTAVGRLTRLAGTPREAIPYLRQALQVAPDNREIRYNLAQAYHMIGESDKADKVFPVTNP